MASRHSLMWMLTAASLSGGCSLIDDGPEDAQAYKVAEGTVRVTDDWSCVADKDGAWNCGEANPEPAYVPELPVLNTAEDETEPEPELVSEPESEPASELMSEPAPESDSPFEPESEAHHAVGGGSWQQVPADGYVLQLAAHRSEANAHRALATLDTQGAEVVKTRGERGNFFVIILGGYPNLSQATAAANDFQSLNSGVDYWIRDASGFLDSL